MGKKARPPMTSPALGIWRGRRAKHKPKRFLRRLVNYLKSDSYMYAPLISSSRSSSSKRKHGLFGRDGLFVNREGLEIGPGDYGKDRKKKRLVEMIWEYLKSDSYLYTPLLEGEFAVDARKEIVDSSHRGAPSVTKSITTSIGKTALTRITNNQSMDVITEGQTEQSLASSHELDNVNNQTLEQSEIVKQFVYPNCWTSLLSVGDDIGRGLIAERVAHRRKIPIE